MLSATEFLEPKAKMSKIYEEKKNTTNGYDMQHISWIEYKINSGLEKLQRSAV